MRIRSITAATALLALAWATTGCTKSAPEITDEQVAAWRALAAETIPAAKAITIDVSQDVTMAGQSTSIDITVSFANFADMKASDQAVADLDAIVGEQAGAVAVITKAVNDGSDAFEAEVSARLVAGVSGLEDAIAFESIAYATETSGPALWVSVYLYVTDPAVLDPAWLDEVSTITQQVAVDAGGQISTISILPADAATMDLSDPSLDGTRIRVDRLQAFKDSGVEDGCVRTDSWAYDVSESYVAPYPADEPGGACS